MFNGNLDVAHDPYLMVAVRTALVSAYQKVTNVKVCHVSCTDRTSTPTVGVSAITEAGYVYHTVSLDRTIYDLVCRRVIESIPEAEFYPV